MSTPNSETLVLVDGSSLAFRSYYALLTTGLRSKSGVPTWAVHGFFASLFDLIEKQYPGHLAVCFDVDGPTFRHVEYTEYKANRQEMPNELAVQWPIIKEGVEVLSIPVYELEGFEADDVIGTVAKRAQKEGMKVIILTGDQDSFQLLEASPEEENPIRVLMPSKGVLMTFGRKEVYEKLGVYPEQIIDYKALCGDTSDNIPGIRGIGKVTAQKLLSEYKTLDNIYSHVDEIKSPSMKQKLIEGRKSAYASQHLATIKLDVPVDFDFEHCKLSMPELPKVGQFFRNLDFRTLVNRLPRVLVHFGSNGPDLTNAEQIAEELGGLMQRRTQAGIGASDNGTTGAGQGAGQGKSTSAVLIKPQLKIASSFTPHVVTTEQELDSLVAELAQQTVIAIDLETSGLDALSTDIVGWAFGWTKGISRAEDQLISLAPNYTEESWEVKTAYIPVRHSFISQVPQLDPDLVAQKLKPILEDPNIGKIAQNAKFELHTLSVIGITVAPIVFDPMLASYIVNPDDKHGLKDQSERLLNYSMVRIDDIIGSGRKQATMLQVPVERAAPYAADDARISIELARYYSLHMEKDLRKVLADVELPLEEVIARMEQAGVGLDVPYLDKLSKELGDELRRLETEIFEAAGHHFNIMSTMQLQKVLFEELGLKSKTRTKSGGFSTDAEVLEKLRSEHAIVGKILDYRHVAKLRSTYVDALPKQVLTRTKRLHGEFNQTVAATGRLSSSNPNLQNIPIRTDIGRQIRRAFIPGDSDSVLLSADYSQIELRMLAHMSGDETLIDAFEKDQDIHARTAQEIFDIPIEEVTADMRRVGKTINFALIYQQGAMATAQDLGITTKEAQKFIEKYFSRYPKVRGFMQTTVEDARVDGYVSTLWGRRRYFRHLMDRNDGIRKADERAACNAPLQGSAADLIKLAMIRLDRELRKRRLRSRLIMQVHDELVLEVPKTEVDETKSIVLSSMELDQPLKVPLKVDMGVGPNWLDAK